MYGRRLVRIVHDSRFAPAEDGGLRADGLGRRLPRGRRRRRTSARRSGRADAAMYAAKHRGRDEFAVGRQRRRAVTPGGGELRRNPVSGKLTIVAPARASRPGGRAGARRRRAPPVPVLRRQRGAHAAGGGRRCVPAAAPRTRPAGACASCPTSIPPSPAGTR